jgi:hypothetical protein
MQIISANYDPSVSGLPGNVGDTAGVAGGASAWVKFGTAVTDWRAFPGEEGGGGGGWQLVERKVILVDAQFYDFLGLNGDVDEAYKITAEVKGGVGSGGGLLSVRPNGLSTNADAFGTGCDPFATPPDDQPFPDQRAEMALGYIPVAGRLAISEGTLFAKTGSDRMMNSLTSVASIRRFSTFGSRWTDTATNITFLRIFSAAATGLGVGSVLTLFKRTIPS